MTRYLLALMLILPLQAVGTALPHLAVCYNYGCKVRATIVITPKDLAVISTLFLHTASAREERSSIRQAIALMEQIAGRQLPTSNDVGGNYQGGVPKNGQMDCIDESLNTTTYLTFFQQHDLLHWHTVEKRAFRAPYLLDQHWSAQIRELKTGRRYVVDSWFDDNGKPPLIQPVEDWQKKR